MDINTAIKISHETAEEKGFWEEKDRRVKLLLIHCEISEAVEELRKDNEQAYKEELCDIAIRLFDLMGHEQNHPSTNFESLIKQKMQYNKTRPKKHGKEF